MLDTGAGVKEVREMTALYSNEVNSYGLSSIRY